MSRITIQPLREIPECTERAAVWFHQKWGIPLDAYRESMQECVRRQTGVPQWYLALDENQQIVAGAGVIDNDFHDRPDLRPNVCAVFVEEPCRGQGIARRLLDFIRRDMGHMGFETVYLVTDHTDFYEKCGWTFLTMVQDTQGNEERLYMAATW